MDVERASTETVRNRLLNAARALFCRQGIRATGVDEIIREAGVARMTLYHQFGSKNGLIAACLRAEGEEWRAWFFNRIARGQTPVDSLLEVFDALEEWFGSAAFHGCSLMNAVAEHRNQDAAILAETLAHKRPVISRLADLARHAGARDPEALAGQIDLLIDGAIVKAMISGKPAAAREARAMAATLVAASVGRLPC